MPLIIDANKISHCVGNNNEALPILRALVKNKACMVYGGTKLLTEYSRHSQFLRLVQELKSKGSAILIPLIDIDREEQKFVDSGLMASDDPHILALASVSGARLLYTEDAELIRDFKNRLILS